MTYKYKLHPAAQEEYESSVSWYLKRSLKAATNFVNAVENRFVNICNDPRRYPNEFKHYHECVIHSYPFTIVYTIEESRKLIVIIAVYHQKRDPSKKYR
ncbi:MAG TPA: type II toxin-antitoxin system RelE/ParE family toxin [Mucilaginibacter sp.]|jgi:plasmid stabilization system protein ParE|nr:type II toxin-antitoxin system RelE/ParE family toxin [Mucilaginibacter sp.]